MTERLIIQSLLDYINNNITLPTTLVLEDLNTKGLCLSLQQLPSEKYYQKDMCGNEDGTFSFAIYSQNTNVDKVSIIKPLWDISDYFDSHSQDLILTNKTTVKIEMSNTPSIYAQRDDGTIIYQAVYNLEYYKEV